MRVRNVNRALIKAILTFITALYSSGVRTSIDSMPGTHAPMA